MLRNFLKKLMLHSSLRSSKNIRSTTKFSGLLKKRNYRKTSKSMSGVLAKEYTEEELKFLQTIKRLWKDLIS
jgi:hypothetical protein